MKTYYCVMSELYDNGNVKANIIRRHCREKPRNTSRSFYGMDAYMDWFEDKAEAEMFLAETKAA